MITLTNGHIQNASSIFVPNGSISFQLNVDAHVIASPGGFVCADIPITFQLDSSGNLIQPCKIWSNSELQPQLSPTLLGTYYLVSIRDQNGAALSQPMWWQFPEINGSTVDISQMTPVSTVGGVVIFYPTSLGGGGSVTSVAFVGDGVVDSATPSTAVTTTGNITATILSQSANTFLGGPTSGPSAAPTFRVLTSADLPAGAALWSNLGNAAADLTLANAGFNTTFNQTSAVTWQWANATASSGGGNQSSPILALGGTYWTGSASAANIWTLQDVTSAGNNPVRTLTLTGGASSGGQLFHVLTALTADGLASFGNNVALNNGFLQIALVNTPALIFKGNTAATGGGNVNSGQFKLVGEFWNGSVSTDEIWLMGVVEGAGTNPTTRLAITHSGTPGSASVAAPSLTVNAATITGGAGEVSFGTTQGFGTGSAGTAVTTTTKGGGTGPTTAEVVVNYLEIDIAGTKFFIPLVQ